MSIHTTIEKPGIYFITFTCHNWIPLIEITNSYDLVYKWFDVLTRKGHTITGYVIMPNHIHLLLYYSGGKQSLNTIIGNGKRFMAYGFIKRLYNAGNIHLLERLNSAVHYKDRTKGQIHEIWEDSFDVKQCRTEKFILQKLNYMHWNPCVERWKLVKHTYDYQHSSASFYELGKKLYMDLKDYRDFLCLID
jgi:REP element-mobilizing transposase RayT